jgi:acetyltransferase
MGHGLGDGSLGLERVRFELNHDRALSFCFDAFSSREPVSTSLENALDRQDLRRFSDALRLPNGQAIVVRFVLREDGVALQRYFKTLSPSARYNRFTGASNGLSDRELDLLMRIGDQNRFALIAEKKVDGTDRIVGEMRYRFDAITGGVEFGLSVGDNERGQGIGSALLSNLECRAADLGATFIYGDTLRSNDEMKALARKAGLAFSSRPDDWRELRMIKPIRLHADRLACAGWHRDAAPTRAQRVRAG